MKREQELFRTKRSTSDHVVFYKAEAKMSEEIQELRWQLDK